MASIDKRVSLFELEILAMTANFPSIRAVARAAGLKPTHVSKLLSRLEEKLQMTLFRRSAIGIELSREGKRALAAARKILSASEELFVSNSKPITKEPLTIGSLSYLVREIAVQVVPKIQKKLPDQRFRIVNASSEMLLASSIRGAFDIIVSDKKLGWSSSWTTVPAASIKWALYGRKEHPLCQQSSGNEILKYPFLVPTYLNQNGFTDGSDECPIPWNKRIRGHETATADIAACLVLSSDQLAFIPQLIGRNNGLVEIQVKECKPQKQQLFLSVNSDTVKKSIFDMFLSTLQMLSN